MASINISEEDFGTLAEAANDAKTAGDMELALKLDKIARKMNAALTNVSTSQARRLMGASGKSMAWEQAPSTLI